ncbi:MAG: hypothetical protein KBA64_07565 [Armatimonadetes bacterium]|jgi:lysophospholipase L1-like esterase|nr:hypothetical protein [Armatimonadota bacterium]MDI9603098.1 GDSL-type esterase/lipase family protein [Acidobacteriota bacterium]
MAYTLMFASLLSCAQVADIRPTDPPSWAVVVDGATRSIRPPVVLSVRGEHAVLPAGEPSWRSGAMLNLCRVEPPHYYHCCQGLLHPETLRVASGPETDAVVFERGVDYLLDGDWAAVTRVEGGGIAEGQEVWLEYSLGFQRVDTIARGPEGQVAVFEGGDVRCGPLPGATPQGWETLARVWVRGAAEAITERDLFPNQPDRAAEFVATWRATETNVGPEYAARTLAKLRAGEPVTIVCLGDSVTAGGDLASVVGQGYVGALERELKRRFPGGRIDVINAGVGGTPSAFGLERLQRDVLDHHPDLVTVMFSLNDAGTPADVYAAQLTEITDRCEAEGAEVIHMTSNFMTETWFGRLGDANETVREVARDTGTGLVDAYRYWELLEYQGVPYETLLLNTINHPDERGHRFFVDELMRFFPAE